MYRSTVSQHSYQFADLRSLMAKATPARSGDYLAGIAAQSAEERMAAKMALADLPLLQQSTRPDAWRQWFESQGVDALRAMAGPRYEQYSMQVAAATSGLGVALMPTLLIEVELATGSLVVASAHPVLSRRSYYLVQPDLPERPALTLFKSWLLARSAQQQLMPAGITPPDAAARDR